VPTFDVPDLGADLGLGLYASSTPGIGGRLRVKPEDFQVLEDSAPVREADGEGKYTLARVRAKNWETHRLVHELAKRLSIDRRSVYVTGTKDKRAVTVQNVAIQAPQANVEALDVSGIELLDTWRVDRAPKLGEHRANAFQIRIREFEVDGYEALARAEAIVDELAELGGFPNFFGPQRFGSVRPVTHEVGRHLVEGDIGKAVWTYIAQPARNASKEDREARFEILESRNLDRAREYIPNRFDHEHVLMDHLAKNPDDFEGAFRKLDLNLARLFVSAYQSHLFNRAVTRRAREGGLANARAGDVLAPADDHGHPNTDRRVPVRKGTLKRCQEATTSRQGFTTAFLPGYESSLPEGLQGQIERTLLDEDDRALDDFRILDLPKLSADGTRRAMVCPLIDCGVELNEDEVGPYIELSFTLPKGNYATCLLREVMKSNLEAYR